MIRHETTNSTKPLTNNLHVAPPFFKHT